MSRPVAIGAAITAYEALLPVLRRNLAPAAYVLVTSFAGATLLGPVGAIPGAAAGAGLALYAQRMLNFFLIAINFVAENPVVSAAIYTAIGYLRDFLRNPGQNNNQIMDHPHPQ